MKQQELVTKKPNTLTDSKDGVISRLPVRKLINVINYLIEQNMTETILVPLVEIKKLLNLNSNDYAELIINYLEDLKNSEISLRDFKYKGKDYKWIKSSVITKMAIYKENHILFLQIDVANEIIEGLKQKNNYTPIDLNISNQFKSVYALKIYELYKRWENYPTASFLLGFEASFTINFNEANEYFGTKFNYPSKYTEAFLRGLKEIKTLTDLDIELQYNKREKLFTFWWVKKDDEKFTEFKTFKQHVRKNYVNKIIIKYTQKDRKEIQLSVNKEGKLYNQLDTTPIRATNANELWRWLFENQSKWRKKL
jgi:hypothetical protein